MRGLLKPLIPLNACKVTLFSSILQIFRQKNHFPPFSNFSYSTWSVRPKYSFGFFHRFVIFQSRFYLTCLEIVGRYDVLLQHVLNLLSVRV